MSATTHEQLQCYNRRTDQFFAMQLLINDPSMSFACRMYCIFARVCLLNDRLFNRLKEGLDVLPWRCVDNTYPDFVKEAFKWNASYGHDQKKMDAHFDWWYQQVFHNPSIEFKFTEEDGIGAYAKFPGVLLTYTNDLYGFVEYVDEKTFDHLKTVMNHWSLFSYRDNDGQLHSCIIYGTSCLVNHDRLGTGKLTILNSELDAQEGGLQLTYYEEVMDYNDGSSYVIDANVLTLQVKRVDYRFAYQVLTHEQHEARVDLYTRINVHDLCYYGYRIKRYLVGEQLFIDYGSNFDML